MSRDRLVFDTSSLIAILFGEVDTPLAVVYDHHVLDLTFYEAGNVCWKAAHLQDRLSDETAQLFLEALADLPKEVTVHTIADLDPERVFEIATAEDLTFYDSAYCACAETLLVTEDTELQAVADGVSVRDLKTGSS